jgi:hypothetical protein
MVNSWESCKVAIGRMIMTDKLLRMGQNPFPVFS